MNFRTLVDAALNEGRPAHRKPRTMFWLARQTKVSRAQLYNFIDGKQTAQPWTVAKIALGLDLAQQTVEDALAASREECEVTS